MKRFLLVLFVVCLFSVVEVNAECPAGEPCVDEGGGDNVPPVITISQYIPLSLSVDVTYVDWLQYATAYDNVDGYISRRIMLYDGVNYGIPGGYIVRYTVTDTAGNTAVHTCYIEII